jgi:hypothetical protein
MTEQSQRDAILLEESRGARTVMKKQKKSILFGISRSSFA